MQQTAASVYCQETNGSQKKLLNPVMSNMRYTGRATVAHFKDSANPNHHLYEILDKWFLNANNTCSKPAEPCITAVTILNDVAAVTRS